MKKVILVIATLGICYQGIGQEKYVVSALTAVQNKNYDEAKEDIDKAMASPETKEKPKALLAKAEIYMTLQSLDKYKANNPYREAIPALFKLTETKPDYEKATVDQLLLGAAFLSFNDGVKLYNDKKYAESAELMKTVIKIHDMNGGKRFEKILAARQPQFDTAAADASVTIANSAFYMNNYDEAIPLLLKVKNNGIRKSPSTYELLIKAYTNQKNTTEELAMIQEGRKDFPEDPTLRNFELNYYIQSGKQEDLVKKLEEAAAKDPKNADLQFNIATTYVGMANPKEGPKPANAAELMSKSEAAYQRAATLDPDNAGINYNFGAYYYNQVPDVIKQMNAITGTSAADQKKYDELKAKSDGLFVKAQPYFEKAYTTLAAKGAEVKGEDLKTYKSTLVVLKEIYARQSKMDKSAEMKKKLDALN